MAEVLTSGTQRAVYMLSHTHEHVISLLVCVFVCTASTGQGSLALPYLDSQSGGVRVTWVYSGILAIGTKTQKLDLTSVQEC